MQGFISQSFLWPLKCRARLRQAIWGCAQWMRDNTFISGFLCQHALNSCPGMIATILAFPLYICFALDCKANFQPMSPQFCKQIRTEGKGRGSLLTFYCCHFSAGTKGRLPCWKISNLARGRPDALLASPQLAD